MRLKLLFLLFFLFSFSWAQTTLTFSTPMTSTFKVPAGVTSLNVECWGGGGAGGGVQTPALISLFGGGGGGGGAYSRVATFGVTPATVLNYKVGAGGVGANGADGPNGETTNFSTVTANGGTGGKNGNTTQGTGGLGGTLSGVGSFLGGNGVSSGLVGVILPVLSSGGGGGSAGPGPSGTGVNGNNANNALVTPGGAAVTGGGKGGDGMAVLGGGNGDPGTSPGGGGAGALGLLGANFKGGNGGNGQIKVTYTCPTYALTAPATADDVCIAAGTSTIIRLTGGASLPNGDYEVTYNRSNPNATGLKATMSVTGGTGIGTFTAVGLNTVGQSIITVTNLKSESCTNAISTNRTVTVNVYSSSVGGSINTPVAICTGSAGGLLTLSGHTGTILGWEYAVGPFTSWLPISNVTSTHSPGILTQTTQFRAIVKNGACSQTTSAITTVNVNPLNTIALSSAVGTDVQSKCISTAITNITYNTVGATGASFSGLPAGVSGGWAGNVVTISGVPTAAGIFNYEITLTGGCGIIKKTGTITVKPRPVPSFITPAKAQTCGEMHTIYATQSGQSNYNWTVSGTVNVDYNLIARGTSTDFDIVVEWLTAGLKTITVNYDNSDGCNGTTPATFSTEVLVIDKGQVHGGKHICKEDALPTLTLTSIAASNIPYPNPSLVLKWQYSDDINNATWHDIPGTTGQTVYTPTSIPVSFRTYRAILENVLTCTKESIETRINIDAFEVPTFGAITYPTCDVVTGNVVINNLPEGNWTLYQNGKFVTNGTGVTYTLSGLAGGIYTFTVTEGSCTSNASLPLDINQPANIWDGVKWSKTGDTTLPAAGDKIVFDGSYIISNDITGCSCTVNSGDVVVNSGKNLTIKNEVTVNSGTLTFENNASLVQENAAAINSGDIIYQRTSAPMKNFDFTYWSSPVANQTLVGLSPNTLWDKYMSYTGSAWKEELSSDLMEAGIGYIIRTPKAGTWPNGEIVSFPYSQSVEFIGVPNNGNITGQHVIAGNYYLIGNPYPCAISADKFLFANPNPNNSGILKGTIYFWTHNTPLKIINSKLSYSSSDYASYNGVGGTATLPALSGGQTPSGKIAAGQSFFARAEADGTVVFNNGMRIQGDNNQFFKPAKTAKPSLLEKHRIWLNMSNKEGAFKQLLIGYIEGATNEYDGDFDGITLNGNAYIDFYSMNQDKKLVIQGRAMPFVDSDIVPLGYRTIIAGNFTISIDKTDGMLSNQIVYLEDKITNTINDLSQNDYTFNTATGVFNNRFVLRYTNKTLADVEFEQDSNNNVLAWIDNKSLRLVSKGENINKVYIYDISGKLVYTDSEISSSEVIISNLKLKNEVILTKIVLANEDIINKKVIVTTE